MCQPGGSAGMGVPTTWAAAVPVTNNITATKLKNRGIIFFMASPPERKYVHCLHSTDAAAPEKVPALTRDDTYIL
jgi:hypothetical protein